MSLAEFAAALVEHIMHECGWSMEDATMWVLARLAESTVPSLLATPGKPPAYASLLAGADCIRITADSVAMISDAIWTGKPVALVPIAINRLGRLAVTLWNRLLPGKRVYPNDLRFFWNSLAKLGITERLSIPKTSTSREMRAIFDRIRPILETPR